MHHHIDQQSQQPAENKTLSELAEHITESGDFGIAISYDNPVCAISFCLFYCLAN
jgi:hypothetical protein